MTDKRKSFLIYIDTLPLFDDLEEPDELNLYRAINLYHRALPFNLTPVTKPLFKLFEAQFIRDKERYDKRCEKNRANVLKRYESLQSNTNEDESEQSHTKFTDRDSDREKDRYRGSYYINPLSFRFSPYCLETLPDEFRKEAEDLSFKGDTESVYLRFRDYWTRKETKKSDWIAAWRNWLKREKPSGTVAERNAEILNRRYGDG